MDFLEHRRWDGTHVRERYSTFSARSHWAMYEIDVVQWLYCNIDSMNRLCTPRTSHDRVDLQDPACPPISRTRSHALTSALLESLSVYGCVAVCAGVNMGEMHDVHCICTDLIALTAELDVVHLVGRSSSVYM
jgi:hypothetical protein